MKYSMLTIDDSQMNRDILNALFEDQYDMIEAADGAEALQILEACQGNIDVILLDLMMPKMDGIEVLKILKSNEDLRGIPVIVITASSNIEDQVASFNHGASDFIAKPFVPEIVISRVNNVVESMKKYSILRNEKEELKQKVDLDQMTGLLNKTTVETLIKEEMVRNHMRLHALMIIDIDNFKSVNDLEGHMVGDHTIKIISNQIVSQFRSSDIKGRIGGDEFVVFMSNIPGKEVARKKATELALLLKYKPNLTIPANVSVSIGLSFTDTDGFTYEELFKAADEALYEAKKNGKARMCESGQEYIKLEDDKRDAVLLFSRNRNVCSTVKAVYSMSHVVLEAMSIENLKEIKEKLKDKVVLSYLDVSDETDDGERFFTHIAKDEKWIMNSPSITICEEGNLNQFKIAMQNGTSDILTVPLDIEALKRRTRRYLNHESAGIVAKEEPMSLNKI